MAAPTLHLRVGDEVDYNCLDDVWAAARVESSHGHHLQLRFQTGLEDVTHRLDLRAHGVASRLAPAGFHSVPLMVGQPVDVLRRTAASDQLGASEQWLRGEVIAARQGSDSSPRSGHSVAVRITSSGDAVLGSSYGVPRGAHGAPHPPADADIILTDPLSLAPPGTFSKQVPTSADIRPHLPSLVPVGLRDLTARAGAVFRGSPAVCSRVTAAGRGGLLDYDLVDVLPRLRRPGVAPAASFSAGARDREGSGRGRAASRSTEPGSGADGKREGGGGHARRSPGGPSGASPTAALSAAAAAAASGHLFHPPSSAALLTRALRRAASASLHAGGGGGGVHTEGGRTHLPGGSGVGGSRGQSRRTSCSDIALAPTALVPGGGGAAAVAGGSAASTSSRHGFGAPSASPGPGEARVWQLARVKWLPAGSPAAIAAAAAGSGLVPSGHSAAAVDRRGGAADPAATGTSHAHTPSAPHATDAPPLTCHAFWYEPSLQSPSGRRVVPRLCCAPLEQLVAVAPPGSHTLPFVRGQRVEIRRLAGRWALGDVVHADRTSVAVRVTRTLPPELDRNALKPCAVPVFGKNASRLRVLHTKQRRGRSAGTAGHAPLAPIGEGTASPRPAAAAAARPRSLTAAAVGSGGGIAEVAAPASQPPSDPPVDSPVSPSTFPSDASPVPLGGDYPPALFTAGAAPAAPITAPEGSYAPGAAYALGADPPVPLGPEAPLEGYSQQPPALATSSSSTVGNDAAAEAAAAAAASAMTAQAPLSVACVTEVSSNSSSSGGSNGEIGGAADRIATAGESPLFSSSAALSAPAAAVSIARPPQQPLVHKPLGHHYQQSVRTLGVGTVRSLVSRLEQNSAAVAAATVASTAAAAAAAPSAASSITPAGGSSGGEGEDGAPAARHAAAAASAGDPSHRASSSSSSSGVSPPLSTYSVEGPGHHHAPPSDGFVSASSALFASATAAATPGFRGPGTSSAVSAFSMGTPATMEEGGEEGQVLGPGGAAAGSLDRARRVMRAAGDKVAVMAAEAEPQGCVPAHRGMHASASTFALAAFTTPASSPVGNGPTPAGVSEEGPGHPGGWGAGHPGHHPGGGAHPAAAAPSRHARVDHMMHPEAAPLVPQPTEGLPEHGAVETRTQRVRSVSHSDHRDARRSAGPPGVEAASSSPDGGMDGEPYQPYPASLEDAVASLGLGGGEGIEVVPAHLWHFLVSRPGHYCFTGAAEGGGALVLLADSGKPAPHPSASSSSSSGGGGGGGGERGVSTDGLPPASAPSTPTQSAGTSPRAPGGLRSLFSWGAAFGRGGAAKGGAAVSPVPAPPAPNAASEWGSHAHNHGADHHKPHAAAGAGGGAGS